MRITYIDLFSGCGGLSLGLDQSGLKCLAAIDYDEKAVQVYKENFPNTKTVIQEDLRKYSPAELSKLINIQDVDVIVGGPPCQGYSVVRQRDGSNSGSRLIADSRRDLYLEFLKYIKHFSPKLFVMENVLGLRSAAGGRYFVDIQKKARALGYRVHGTTIKTWEFGVPQKRERQLVIGSRIDLPLFSSNYYLIPTHSYKDMLEGREEFISLWEAIGDLPPLKSGENTSTYDKERFKRHLARYGGRFLIDVLKVDVRRKLTAHVARPQNERDLRDFGRLREGENGIQAIKRGANMEYPYDKNSFADRFFKLHRRDLSSTIVAHIDKDGLRYVHPTQKRSLTPREAARIQSFPDWFDFTVPRTHAYRLIGNAFPPLAAKNVGEGIAKWLKTNAFDRKQTRTEAGIILGAEKSLITRLLKSSKKIDFSKLSKKEFLAYWIAVGHIFNNLHPEAGINVTKTNGNHSYLKDTSHSIDRANENGKESVASGWPLTLLPLLMEANKRMVAKRISFDEYSSPFASTSKIPTRED